MQIVAHLVAHLAEMKAIAEAVDVALTRDVASLVAAALITWWWVIEGKLFRRRH